MSENSRNDHVSQRNIQGPFHVVHPAILLPFIPAVPHIQEKIVKRTPIKHWVPGTPGKPRGKRREQNLPGKHGKHRKAVKSFGKKKQLNQFFGLDLPLGFPFMVDDWFIVQGNLILRGCMCASSSCISGLLIPI